MERKLLILLVLLVGFGSLNAQSIRGTVTDPKQEAVIGATVKVEGTPFGVVS